VRRTPCYEVIVRISAIIAAISSRWINKFGVSRQNAMTCRATHVADALCSSLKLF
jgi:hypothetical protein